MTPSRAPETTPESTPEWRQKVFGLDENHHPQVLKLSRNASWFARGCLRNDRTHGGWLVVAGNTGCGKTHVAERVREFVGLRLIDAWSRGWLSEHFLHSPAFIRWDRAADMDEDDWDATIDRLVKPAHLVVLDDVGAETDRYKSGVPKARLKELLDLAEPKWLFMTTNLKREQWEEAWGQRVADRLSKARYLSLFDVPSYRGNKT